MQTPARKLSLLATAMTLGLALTVSACGGDNDKDSDPKPAVEDKAAYCDALEAAAPDLAGFADPTGSPDFSRFSILTAEIQSIAEKSPEDMVADWATLADPLVALDAALKAADTDIQSVIGSAATGKLPAGVSASEMTSIGQKLAALQTPEVKAVGEKIKVTGKDDCGIDFVAAN